MARGTPASPAQACTFTSPFTQACTSHTQTHVHKKAKKQSMCTRTRVHACLHVHTGHPGLVHVLRGRQRLRCLLWRISRGCSSAPQWPQPQLACGSTTVRSWLQDTCGTHLALAFCATCDGTWHRAPWVLEGIMRVGCAQLVVEASHARCSCAQHRRAHHARSFVCP